MKHLYKFICLTIIAISLFSHKIQASYIRDFELERTLNVQNSNWTTAAMEGKIGKIRELISTSNFDPKNPLNALYAVGISLVLAASHGREEILKTLLTIPGININATNGAGQTALFTAVEAQRENIINILLQVPGIEVNCGALEYAASKGYNRMVELLIKVPGIDINKQDKEGDTSLTLAAFWADVDTVKILLAAHANIHARDKHGNTVLHSAAYRDKTNILEFLLTIPGIDVNARNNRGQTPIQYAVTSFKLHNAKILQNKLISLAFEAVKNNNIESLKSVVEQIGSDNIIDKDQNTILTKAVAPYNAAMIELILQNSKDPRQLLAKVPFEEIGALHSDLFRVYVDMAFATKLDSTSDEPSIKADEAETFAKSLSKKPIADQYPDLYTLYLDHVAATFRSAKAQEKEKPAPVEHPCSNPACPNPTRECEQKCSGCKKVYYCSKSCQKAEWVTHKYLCKKS